MKALLRKFMIRFILVFGLCLSGVFIAAIWSEDIDAKNSEPNDYPMSFPVKSYSEWYDDEPNEPDNKD